MNDLTRYEKELAEQSKHLPLPDKTSAWEKMKKLLDDDDNGVIIVPPTPNSNGSKFLWSFLLLLLVSAITWYFVHSAKKDVPKADQELAGLQKKHEYPDNTAANAINDPQKRKNEEKKAFSDNNIVNNNAAQIIADETRTVGARSRDKTKKGNDKAIAAGAVKNNSKKGRTINTRKNLTGHKALVISKKGALRSKSIAADMEEEQPDSTVSKPASEVIEDTAVLSQNSVFFPQTDTITKNDTVAVQEPVKMKEDSLITAKKNENNKKKYYLSVGISVQQTIGLNRNSGYFQDNYTNTILFSDYLPSIYMRLYNKKKWFVQTEFKYAAPEYIEDFMYRSGIKDEPYDFIASTRILKKVYYHKIQGSFNYFVLPRWPVGAGVIYNIYSSQIGHAEVNKKLYGLSDSLISSDILKGRTDSNFVSFKNYFQLFIETQFEWDRFSAGARYAFAVQPYVEYVDPYSGQSRQRNNNTLHLFIRYELSKPKK